MKCILRCFELASCLKVNFSKSGCVGLCVPENEVGMFASILNCKISSLPVVYLGIPIRGNPRQINLWQPILRKMRRKLTT